MGRRKPNWRRMAEAACLRRGELGLTQDELIAAMPEHLNVGIETLRRVEAGDRKTYRPVTLAAVSSALGKPPSWLWNVAHGAESGDDVGARIDELDERLSRIEDQVDDLLRRAERPDG